MNVTRVSGSNVAVADNPGLRKRRVVILTEDSKPALGGIAEYLHQLALATSVRDDILIVTSVPGAEALNPGLPFQYREARWFRAQDPRTGDRFAPIRRLNTVIWHATRRRRVKEMLAEIHRQQPMSSYVIGRLSPVTFPWCVACLELGLDYSAIGYGLELIEPLARRDTQRRAEFAHRAVHWFAISQDTHDKLVQVGVPPERQSMLLPGVAVPPPPFASPEERRALRSIVGISERPYIFSLCYLRRRKGVDLAIEAFANVAAEFPQLTYVVGGSGPEGDALAALARSRGVADRVIFAGTIDEATKGALFADCELFILPTRVETYDVEGFGIVFLEAGLYGKAVIGGDGGGVPEAIDDGVTGVLVDTRDSTDVTLALRRLLRDPATVAAMGRSARERARRDFSWAARGRAFAEQIDAVAASVSARREPQSNEGLTRVRRGAGLASNRVIASAYVLGEVARDGRLFEYLSSRVSPPDLGSCARETLAWLMRACAAGGYGGAAAGYHLTDGWAGSYPEITGYLIPTLLHYDKKKPESVLVDVARSAGAWLAETRLPDGAICRKQWYPGNTVPSVFNTGQVIEGWCSLAKAGVPPLVRGHDWLSLAKQSGDWLLGEQEADGSWVRNAFNGISHTYYARVASPLAWLGHVSGENRFTDAARRALDWVLSRQTESGWFKSAGFTAGEAPTTHTIGYVIEGLLRAGRLLDEHRYIEAAERAARRLLLEYESRGWLPGRFSSGWHPRAQWRCLTGDAQVAITWCVLHGLNGEPRYQRAATRVADGLRRTVRITTKWPEISGGIQGSWPAWGDYDPYGYPTHAAKFALDLFALLGA